MRAGKEDAGRRGPNQLDNDLWQSYFVEFQCQSPAADSRPRMNDGEGTTKDKPPLRSNEKHLET